MAAILKFLADDATDSTPPASSGQMSVWCMIFVDN